MKIVCDACQAKYSISDDKVQGKVFKIRCKKCSNIIVVRGGANAAEAAPPPEQNKETHVYDYGYDGGGQPAGDEAVWHVVINQDQVGPMTAAEVHQRFGAGEIDAETYIWREGFSDWLPLAQVDTFAAFAAGQAHAHAPAQHGGGGGGADAVAAMFGGGSGSEDAGTMRSDPGDLFAAASASTPPQDDDGGDLFGSRPVGGGASSNVQAQAAGSKMRGERNENSVLFSLNNLAQLASDKPQPMTSAPSGHATGQAGGEGSGLIDIRSMASAYLGGGGAGAKATTSSIGTIDDLPVFGGSGFSEPAVIVPTSRPAANNKILYAMIGAVGLLAVVAVIMVVVLLGNKSNGGDKVASNDKAGTADKADKDKPEKDDKSGTTTPPTTADTGSAAKVADSGSAAKVADSGSAATPPPTGSDTGSATKPTDSGSAATQVAVKDPVKKDPVKKDPPKADPPKHDPPKTTPEVKKDTPRPPDPVKKDDKKPPVASGDCDEVSCVLNNNAGTCCAKFKKGGSTTPTTTAKPAGDLPESLDRDMINNGVGTASGAAKACGNKSSAKGKVKVHVKVGPAGNVVDVSVSETPDAALGNCVAAAMQRAHFGKTQKGGSFAYPFVF